MFSHYDRMRIASLELFQRALEHYTEVEDYKRVHTQNINHEFLAQWFGTLNADIALECMKQLLVHNQQFNIQIVVGYPQYHETLGTEQVIEPFTTTLTTTAQGICYFLGDIINTSRDPEVHYKYITAANSARSKKLSARRALQRV